MSSDFEKEDAITDDFAEICILIEKACNKHEISHEEAIYMIHKGLEHIRNRKAENVT